MTSEVTEHIDRALETAIVNGTDLDDVEDALNDGLDRLDQLRVVRGEA